MARTKRVTVFVDCSEMESIDEFEEIVGREYSKEKGLDYTARGKYHHLTKEAKDTVPTEILYDIDELLDDPNYKLADEPLQPAQQQG